MIEPFRAGFEQGAKAARPGIETDYLFELPEAQREQLLTSMVKRLDLGVERVVAHHEAGTLEVPSAMKLGVAAGCATTCREAPWRRCAASKHASQPARSPSARRRPPR